MVTDPRKILANHVINLTVKPVLPIKPFVKLVLMDLENGLQNLLELLKIPLPLNPNVRPVKPDAENVMPMSKSVFLVWVDITS